MATNFEQRAVRGDPNGYMVVQRMLLWFANNVYDKFVAATLFGSTTIPSGGTSIVVSHSLGNSSYRVIVTALGDPAGRVWVSAKTSSQFTINVSAAVAADTGFDWLVKGV